MDNAPSYLPSWVRFPKENKLSIFNGDKKKGFFPGIGSLHSFCFHEKKKNLYSMFLPFFLFIAYFVKEANPHHGRMEQVIEELSKDDDADVKAFLQIPQMYDSDGEPINDVSVSSFFVKLNITHTKFLISKR